MLADGQVTIMMSLADPPGSSPIGLAVLWLQGALLGSIAIAIAVVAVASVGLLMLGGRIDVRRGLAVIAGCFILFGASAIASGLQSLLVDGREIAGISPDLPPVTPPPSPPAPPANADPYAGASVPAR